MHVCVCLPSMNLRRPREREKKKEGRDVKERSRLNTAREREDARRPCSSETSLENNGLGETAEHGIQPPCETTMDVWIFSSLLFSGHSKAPREC